MKQAVRLGPQPINVPLLDIPSHEGSRPCMVTLAQGGIRLPKSDRGGVGENFSGSCAFPFPQEHRQQQSQVTQQSSHMERKYKPLRPALATTTAEHDSHVGNEDPVPGIKRKRVQVKVACDTCRTKKSAVGNPCLVCTVRRDVADSIYPVRRPATSLHCLCSARIFMYVRWAAP